MAQKPVVIETVGQIVDRHRYRTQCLDCGREAEVDLRAVIAARGPDYKLDRLNQSLRCSNCGARGWPRPIKVWMIWTGGREGGWLQGHAGTTWSQPPADTTHPRKRWRGRKG